MLAVGITGDCIITRRISICRDQGFLALVDILRGADASYTHLDTVIHDYEGPEIYPSAEAGWMWMRSPMFVGEELRWTGVSIVSTASNHSLDYMYGGLASTLSVLKSCGLQCAGSGLNLGIAREAVYLDTSRARIALVSACSTLSRWNRAGASKMDLKGRPGVNPLSYYYIANSNTIDMICNTAVQMGWWVTKVGGDWLFNPPGLHNSVYRFRESDVPQITTVPDELDLEGNLRSIVEARNQADFVIAHLHTHEFDPVGGLSAPARFAVDFAHSCVDAGADLFIANGSHAPIRGIEIYEGKPIFYDPGPFFQMHETVSRLPADFFCHAGYSKVPNIWEATVSDGFAAREPATVPLNPSGGYGAGRSNHGFVTVCKYDDGVRFVKACLYPITFIEKPYSYRGIPTLASGKEALRSLTQMKHLCASFGTELEISQDVGLIQIEPS